MTKPRGNPPNEIIINSQKRLAGVLDNQSCPWWRRFGHPTAAKYAIQALQRGSHTKFGSLNPPHMTVPKRLVMDCSFGTKSPPLARTIQLLCNKDENQFFDDPCLKHWLCWLTPLYSMATLSMTQTRVTVLSGDNCCLPCTQSKPKNRNRRRH
jgi:hypothetical protein